MQDSGGEARKSGFTAFWTTLPGVLTGLAALVTALVGLYALVDGGDGDDGGAPAVEQLGASGTTSRPVPDGAAGSGQPSPDPAAEAGPEPSAGAERDGRVTMRSPDEADLELGRVGMGVDGRDLYWYCSANDCLLLSNNRPMTPLEGPVDRSGCVTSLEARQERSLDNADLTAGSWFCVQTDRAHLVLVEVVSAPGIGSEDLVLDYTFLD